MAKQPAFPKMFSAASFFDVMDAVPKPAESGPPNERPPVIAFYGFRGGAGRTLALAHVASLIARRGKGMRLVVADFDLEAPGIHVPLQADLTNLSDEQGIVPLLHRAISEPRTISLPVVDSLISVAIPTGNGRIFVLPAGKLGKKYLAQVDELNISSWHGYTAPQPLQRLFEDLSSQIQIDAILVDCRTGFSSISATLMFHIADAVVTFTPVSPQVWEGLDILLQGLRVARSIRLGKPDVLFVPSMTPTGEIGKALVAPFVQRLDEMCQKVLGPSTTDDGENISDSEASDNLENSDAAELVEYVFPPGLAYDVRVSTTGLVDRLTEPTYTQLADAVADVIGLEYTPSAPDDLDVSGILEELPELDSPFGEDAPIKALVQHFVRPADMSGVVHPDTLLVIGAKGAGKTWMWRYLIHEQPSTSAQFVSGHAPNVQSAEAGKFQLSKSAIREIEHAAFMPRRNTYTAFWRLYGLVKLMDIDGVSSIVRSSARDKNERLALEKLISVKKIADLQDALSVCLKLSKVGTLAEVAWERVDEHLRSTQRMIALCYDGLDTDFEGTTSVESVRRRQFFVAGLLELILESRARISNIRFKLFLREDVWADVTLQNKSHLGTASVELNWKPEDLWKIALDQLSESPVYASLIERIQPGVSKPWPVDTETLEGLLTPFWGRRVEGTQGRGKALTSRYVMKRITDAKGRVFPRTMLQVLSNAVLEQRKRQPSAGRVISFSALRAALEKASARRIDDLTKEYSQLQMYLLAMRGMNAIASRKEIIASMQAHLRTRGKKQKSGVDAGALQAGAGGWQKVIRQFEDVGVLGPYVVKGRKSDRLTVAMLYRPGLAIKAVGGLH